MKIKLEIKKQFKPRAYPACDKSKILSEIIGKQTFTKEHIKLFKDLGYEIEWSGHTQLRDHFE